MCGLRMALNRIVWLGLSLVGGAAFVFLITWVVLACGDQRKGIIGFDRIWLRWLSVCFYVGMAILLAIALGGIVQNTIRGSR